MKTQSDVLKYLEEAKEKSWNLFIIGVRSVFDSDEFSSFHRRYPEFSILCEHLNRVHGYTEEHLSYVTFYDLANEGNVVDLLFFGSYNVKPLLDRAEEGGFSIENIFYPNPKDDLLLTGVTYRHIDTPPSNEDDKAFTTAISEGEDGDFDPELYIKNLNDSATATSHVGRFSTCTIRKKDALGRIYRDTVSPPCFGASAKASGDTVEWICEVSVPNIASSILEYVGRCKSFKNRGKRKPSAAVQLKLKLLIEYEKYSKGKRAKPEVWANDRKNQSSVARELIDELMQLEKIKKPKISDAHVGIVVSNAIKAARVYKCRQNSR